MSPEVRLELERLLSALCDGSLAQAQQARLEQLLDADAECRRHYLEYMDLHARLLVHPGLSGKDPLPSDATLPGGSGFPAGSAPGMSARPLSPTPGRPAPQRRRPQVGQVLRYVLVATTTLAASLLVQVFWWHPRGSEDSRSPSPETAQARPAHSEHVATLIQTVDCVWKDPRNTWRIGSHLLPGELHLQKGLARIRLDTGAELLVEGPAQLRLDSGTAATLRRGKVVFRTGETAAQFDLHTPSATLVDFGAEYGVAVGPAGEEVHVFEGEVQRVPRAAADGAEPEYFKAGEAHRSGRAPTFPSRPVPLEPARFVRRLPARGPRPPHPGAGLLAYEGFDYRDPQALQTGKANGGSGWTTPWQVSFVRPRKWGRPPRLALNVEQGLVRPGAAVPAVGGCFDHAGFAVCYRRLARPVRLDADGVYYLSFLFRRHGPPACRLNVVALMFRPDEPFPNKPDLSKRLTIGAGGGNQIFTHIGRVSSRASLPLGNDITYLVVVKIVASRSASDQVFMRIYEPREPIGGEEPSSWTIISPPFASDLVFDWLGVHVNSKDRQMIDEIRLGATWSSVTAPWSGVSRAGRQGKP
jgi:hypothetical protein